MILNIVPDEKFLPFLQGLFEEAAPGENLWRVFTDKPKSAFAVKAEGMEIINDEYYASEKFKNDLLLSDCVIFHSQFLSSRKKLVVLSRIPKHMPIIWRGWGFDYYPILQVDGLRLFMPETSSLMKGPNETINEHIGRHPIKILKGIFYKKARQAISNRFIARINYFSCCVPDDFESLKRVMPTFKAQFLPLNYYSAEDIFLRGVGLQNLTGHDILLRNSSNPTNNHIEAMRALSKLGMYGRKVIVPLNYGDMSYQKKIIRAGKDILGKSFYPLTDYMPLPEYNQLISGCGNLIMNHIRQQAIGNISSALLRGGKVFLRSENPIYKYYTRMGVKLFPFSDAITIEDLDVSLNQNEVIKNKEIMLGMWSRVQGIKNVKTIALLGKQGQPE